MRVYKTDDHPVFGIPEKQLPLKGFPKGRIRIKARSNSFLKVYVNDGDSIKHFLVQEENGYWVPDMMIGSNQDAEGDDKLTKHGKITCIILIGIILLGIGYMMGAAN